MFEKLPSALGAALKKVRAGSDRLLLVGEAGDAPEILTVSSPAFGNGDRIPVRFTADGEGVSPPLAWSGLPADTAQVLVVCEDPDIAAPQPFVHLIAVFDPDISGVGEGELNSERATVRIGKHSMGGTGWLPHDPPPGHGAHHYVFQVFALGRRFDWDVHPGKDEVKKAVAGSVLAKGALIGVYERS